MQKGMTEYVVTRWYRAPELVLTHEYTSAVDLWAVGCIIGDLLGRKVLFPGKDFKNQVETICAVLGRPNEEESKHVTSTRAKGFLEKLPDTNKVPFKEMFPCANPDAVDLMEKLLVFNPEKRLTAKQALKHAYVKAFHQEEFEPVFESADLSDIEPRSASGNALNVMEMKRMVISEIYNFRPEAGIFVQHPELIPRKG